MDSNIVRQKIVSIPQWLRLPAVCVLCNQYHSGVYAVCSPCTSLLLPIKHPCSICSLPLTDEKFLQCGFCIKSKPAFDRVFCHYYFEEPLRTLLHEFKYYKGLYLRTFMVKLMLDALPDKPTLGCLVPVPLHASRIRQRGFNQAAELTKLLAKSLKIPFDLTLCKKIINTPSQVSLNRQQRHQNLKKAFTNQSSHYSHITLVDDLLTTGSTSNELAKSLKLQGVQRVDVWCLARAVNG